MARLVPASILRGALVASLVATTLVFGRPECAQGAGGSDSGNSLDYPIPSTAQQAYSPIREGFTAPVDPRADLRGPAPHVDERETALKAARQGEAPFFRDTEIKLNNRSYWFAEDQFGEDKPEALTSGGYLSYQSGLSRQFPPTQRHALYQPAALCAGGRRRHA
ncbi:MAG: hypothetical protein ACM3MH_05520 [Actinomycetota bacterium]